jgi:hypothetical protein
MKSKTTITAIVAGLLFSLLSAEVSMAAGAEGNVRMSRIERAGAVTARATAARRVETFKSERTDSWLCAYVSPFFCTSLFPTLTTTPDPPTTPTTPVRGRN